MFIELFKIEIYKIVKRPRTYIAFGALAVLTILIQLALKTNGKDLLQVFVGSQEDTFVIPHEQILNGYYVCFFILNMLLIHIPLLVALVAGDQISGEASMGTLRFIAGRPISRTQIILAKFLASLLYVVGLLVWLALLGLFCSNWIFGIGDLFVIRQDTLNIIESGDIMWRYLCAFGFAALGLSVIAALGILFSVYSENSIGPIVATVSFVIVCTIIQQLTVPLFEKTVTPWLFTTHMLGWKGFFYPSVYANSDGFEGAVIKGSVENIHAIYRSAIILFAYVVIFLGISIWKFNKSDINT
jgi:ABC-2 type transport system permease protein